MVPGQRKHEGGEITESSEKSDLKKLKALVVDDEEIQIDLLSDILSECGIRNVVTARSGEMAMSLFKLEQPDIVISDVIMIKLSGLRLLRKIKSINEKIPVILISGFHEYRRILENSDVKPDNFMEKPLSPVKIKKLVHEYFPELKKSKKK